MSASTLPGRDAEPIAYSEPYQYAFIVGSPVCTNDLSQKFFQKARWLDSSDATDAVVNALTAVRAVPARVDALGPPLPCLMSPRNTVASSTVEPPARVRCPVTVEPLVLALEKPVPTGRTAIPTSDCTSVEPLRLLCRVA